MSVGMILDSTMALSSKEEEDEMEGKPYHQVLGSMMWGQLATRPDLVYIVSLLSRFQNHPGLAHWNLLMHVIGYIKMIMDYEIIYTQGKSLKPMGFIDADYGGCKDMMRSTLGYVFMMAGGPILWSAKCQATVALSTVKAEFVSLTRAVQQSKWMFLWLKEVRLEQEKLGILKCDNHGAVSLTNMTHNHHKVKHIDIHEHYIHELVRAGDIKMEFIWGKVNAVDLFTKPLHCDHHYRYLVDLNITN
ncbi:uncharacterized protein ARMOST_19807 [Armillaria ostoyae]|uniref:Reverse transcriptase Ty1/copia-type domain-containing protein n=1 Tax=Armillaria ostoyae TaxID=47428 RepID=A0A284S5L5_ARMOS|nr:uncharacterized protein ARMOST_19807 [Armillaria ostoyae]